MSDGKGGRPAKEFKVGRNGNSFSCFFNGEYLGSISRGDLCFYVAEKSGNKHKLEKTRTAAIGEAEVKTQKEVVAQT